MSVSITCKNGIMTTPETKYQRDPKGSGHALFIHLKKYSDRVLQVDGYSGKEETFTSTLERSIRTAIKMKQYGIKKDDVVVLCTTNHLDSCIPVFASLFIGAQVTAFDKSMNDEEATILIKQIDVKIVFVCPKSLDFMEKILKMFDSSPLIVVFGSTSNHINFSEFLTPHIEEEKDFTPVEVKETETAFIFFSSGTSGLPKGICLSHRSFLGQVAAALELNDPFERVLEFSNFFWSMNIFFWGIAILKGCSRVIMNSEEETDIIWRAIANYKPTFLVLIPYAIRTMINHLTPTTNLETIKKIYIAGGVVFDHELVEIRKKFSKAIVVRGYGLTEAGLVLYFPTTTETDLTFLNNKVKSVGRLLHGCSCKVVDVETEEILGPYQKGELRLKTSGVLSEYYKIECSEVFDSDGWLKSGDIVYYDKDFYFYYVDRLKELIKYRGWHVQPKLIEDVLMATSNIAAACVFGIPHELDEEHPVAVVKLKNTSEVNDDTEADICRYVEEKLGDNFKLRGGVKIVNEIPTLANHKYDVRTLKSQVLNGLALKI